MDEMIKALQDACADTDEEDEEELEAVPEPKTTYDLPTHLSSSNLLNAAEASLPWLNFDPADPIVAQMYAEKAAEDAVKLKEKRVAEIKLKLANDSEMELVNLSGVKAFGDEDLRELIYSVCASPRCRGLILSNTGITDLGVKRYMSPFLKDLVSFRVLDMSRCSGITAESEKCLLSAFQVSCCTGVRVEVAGTGLSIEAIAILRNVTPEAQATQEVVDIELARASVLETAFCNNQHELIELWQAETAPCRMIEGDGGEETRATPPPPKREKRASETAPKREELARFTGGGSAGSKARLATMELLREASEIAYKGLFDGGRGRPHRCGGVQLMAHLSYLTEKQELEAPEAFKIEKRPNIDHARLAPLQHKGEEEEEWSLWEAVHRGLAHIETAVAGSQGISLSVELGLRNTSDSTHLVLHLEPGAIFEHTAWAHKQNLAVCRGWRVTLSPGEYRRGLRVRVYGLHSVCPAPSGEVVNLSEFRIPRELCTTLCTQPTLWKHFDAGLKGKSVAAAKAKAKKKAAAAAAVAAGVG